MKLHWLQHVPFEGLGFIEKWARRRGADVRCTRLFAEDAFPAPGHLDLLIVMGGPMGVHDHAACPWLATEKTFIRKAIDSGRRVLGICLGAQLIADVLGATVHKGPEKEIGWFPVRRTEEAPPLLPTELTVFHWHGDTFALPRGAVRLASSDACINQGFLYNNRIAALQFHLETTTQSMEALIENCSHELADAPFIQNAEQMRAGLVHLDGIHAALTGLLDRLM
jgi:GMP synthase (glutamine-hydrolysing)